MSEETIEKTFQVGSSPRLVISNIRGSVTIQPGEAGVIEVKAFKHGNSMTASSVVEMSQDAEGTVRVETRSDESFFGLLSHPPKVEYAVRVPQGTQLDASCISSSLKVMGLTGAFKLKTISGEMEVRDLSGPFKIKGVSGDITGSNLSGELELGTVSGRVKLLQSSFPGADASTVSGDLLLQTPVAAGPYAFSSVSGSVRMLVPPDTHCSAELNSVSGSLHSSLPATSTKLGRGTKISQVGGGGTSVRLKSVSGGLSFEVEGMAAANVSATPEPANNWMPTPPSPPTSPAVPPASPLSTEEILQRIERGEMTVDEAIKLMKGQS